MSILEETADRLISEFGEVVTIVPKGDYEPEDSANPIYFTEGSDGTTFDLKVRLYSNPSDEVVKQYGLEQDEEAVMYSTEGSVEEGDEVQYMDSTFVVTGYNTKQLGNGPYRWIYTLRRTE